MKKLQLENRSYKELLIAFKDWLEVLGYSRSAKESYPNCLKEFFYNLEQKGHYTIMENLCPFIFERKPKKKKVGKRY